MSSYITACTVSSMNCPIFDLLTKEETELLSQSLIQVIYKKGEVICKHGTPASYVIHVSDGLAKVFLDRCSDILVLKIIPSGNFIALTAILEGNTVFPYSAMAYKDTKAILVDIKILREIIKRNPAFATRIIDTLCANAHQIFGRFYCLTHKQLYGRLADILLCLSEKIFKQDSFELDLSRKELGELTKMSTESVVRMLKKFKEDEVIDIQGKIFTIKDFDTLRRISEYG